METYKVDTKWLIELANFLNFGFKILINYCLVQNLVRRRGLNLTLLKMMPKMAVAGLAKTYR